MAKSNMARGAPPASDPTHKSVLSYLRDMESNCQDLHRPDLKREYHDALETAITAIYGPLPARPMCKGYTPLPNYPTENHNQMFIGPDGQLEKRVPKWRQQMIAKPFRRILRTLHDEQNGDKDFLECGHMIWSQIALPGQPRARRRRCPECAREAQAQSQDANKKPAMSASAQSKKAGAV